MDLKKQYELETGNTPYDVGVEDVYTEHFVYWLIDKIDENRERKYEEAFQRFFDFMHQEHDLILTQSQVYDILQEARILANEINFKNHIQ